MIPPRRLAPHSAELPAVLTLIRSCFTYMDGRIDPPSSMHRMTLDTLRDTSRTAELWVTGTTPDACVILTPKSDCLYIGKLAVAAHLRKQGYALGLIQLAEQRARALGLAALELETRIELVENQAAFAAMGFVKTDETAHPGYDRPTAVTMRRPVSPA
jgi:GNAT superfamily N-acetyltransferase